MAKPPKSKSDDEKREDEILRRMLNTPPKPHKPKEDVPKKKTSPQPKSGKR